MKAQYIEFAKGLDMHMRKRDEWEKMIKYPLKFLFYNKQWLHSHIHVEKLIILLWYVLLQHIHMYSFNRLNRCWLNTTCWVQCWRCNSEQTRQTPLSLWACILVEKEEKKEEIKKVKGKEDCSVHCEITIPVDMLKINIQ